MRFVFISTMAGAPWGGSEELWSQAALRLHQQGHDVSASVVWWPQLSSKVLELEKQGIKLFVEKPNRHSFLIRIWHKIKQRLIRIEKKELQWLRLQKPDLVIISQGSNGDGLEWMKLCHKNQWPHVAIVQCNSEIWWPSDKVGNEMALAYRAAKKVFCISRHNLELLECQIGESLPNAEVIWNPFNVPAGQPPAWPADNGSWKLACVARLEPAAKGQDLLFRVLSQSKWRERAIEFNLYGAGPCEGNLRRLIEKYDLKNVYLRGHVADVKTIWEQNHLLILLSRYEGLPLALVEAMWCERPAVVTDIGGNAEMCVDGKTGFVAAAPTVGIIEQTLERAWERRQDWQTMGMAARVRAEQTIPKDPVDEFLRKLEICIHES